MYISRVQINTTRRTMKQLSHLGAYHAWVETSFPANIENHLCPRNLWRIDTSGDKQWLMIVSESKPDIKLLERFGVVGTAATKDYDGFISRLFNGQTARFQLTANPVYKHDGKTYPEVTVDQQLAWLARRASANGFRLVNFDVVGREYNPLVHDKRRMRIANATYSGVLEITDIDKFTNMLVNGIGHERAYGCGLMTVIPM